MKIKQSKEKKEATKRYCKIHKIHYHNNCPQCCEAQQILDRYQHGAGIHYKPGCLSGRTD